MGTFQIKESKVGSFDDVSLENDLEEAPCWAVDSIETIVVCTNLTL